MEKIDQRTESGERPVVRVKGTFTIPAGETLAGQKLILNCVLKRATVLVPTLTGGVTVTVSVLDELGAVVYSKAAIAAGTTFDPAIGSVSLDTPLAGTNTLEVELSGTQSVERVIYVFLYGT